MYKEFFISKTEDGKDLPLPQYQTEGSAGMDLYANIKDDFVLRNGERKLISVGIKIGIPKGFEAQIRPRSGLALKNGVTIVNSPGTIDSDYRGEIKVILINHGKDDFIIRRGDRIGQMVISKVEHVTFNEVNTLDKTVRGEGGFGHTGVN